MPFPGSSLEEKYEAHARREPAPVEELCPDVPGGLALAVRKMMAKRPADRFQSAGETAEALAPFVAGSSASFEAISRTSSWEGSRLTLRDRRTRPRRLLPWAVAGLSLAALAAVLLATAGPSWFGAAPSPDDDRAGPVDRDGGLPPPKPPSAPAGDLDVLTVSKKPEDGGQYRTINAALGKVRPGQTIRVLDGAVYPETLRISSPSRHRGITLEAVRGATIATNTVGNMIEIDGVPGVVLRDFRLEADTPRFMEQGKIICLVLVRAGCAGVTLERLELTGTSSGLYHGVEIAQAETADQGMPFLIQDCVFRQAGAGVTLIGIAGDYVTPLLVSRAVVRNNLILGAAGHAVCAKGQLRDVHIVGNRAWSCQTGFQLEALLPGTSGVLVANNTAFECGYGFRLWDRAPRGEGVQLRNNFLLASKMSDTIFIKSDDRFVPRGFGDGEAIARLWRIDHNWREGKPPARDVAWRQAWIPPSKDDVLKEQIDGVNRDQEELRHFLRPARDSLLATAGAGKTDPSLPSYVGALPPEGTPPWDWDRTWRARVKSDAVTTPGKKSP